MEFYKEDPPSHEIKSRTCWTLFHRLGFGGTKRLTYFHYSLVLCLVHSELAIELENVRLFGYVVSHMGD